MRNVCRFVAGQVASMVTMQGAWAQPYLGFGIANLSLDSEYASIDGRSGTGFTLYGGYEFVPTWPVELSVSAAGIDTGPTVNISYPADSAEYSILRATASPRATPTARVRSAPGRTSCRRLRCTCFAECGRGR